MKETIAVIGAGCTGASWAGLFAAHGYTVRLFDQKPDVAERALAQATAAARFLVAKGLADSSTAEYGIARLATA